MDPSSDIRTGLQHRLVDTFVDLADTLVEDFDVVEFLSMLSERVVEVSIASEVGILLADETGALRFMASSDERSHLLELFQVQNREGPCQDCFTTGEAIAVDDLAEARHRWPLFVDRALATGFRSAQAVPLRLRGEILGAMNLFRTEVGGLDESDLAVVQAMADVATIGLLQQRQLDRAHTVTEQLQGALHSRIGIEQAKGIVSEQAKLPMEEAFARLRGHARNANHKLSDVARAVVAGELSAADLRA